MLRLGDLDYFNGFLALLPSIFSQQDKSIIQSLNTRV